MREQLPDLCQLSWKKWPEGFILDLAYCFDCVQEYHRIKDDFIKDNPQYKKVGLAHSN